MNYDNNNSENKNIESDNNNEIVSISSITFENHIQLNR